jgi:hypothetical protein
MITYPDRDPNSKFQSDFGRIEQSDATLDYAHTIKPLQPFPAGRSREPHLRGDLADR